MLSRERKTCIRYSLHFVIKGLLILQFPSLRVLLPWSWEDFSQRLSLCKLLHDKNDNHEFLGVCHAFSQFSLRTMGCVIPFIWWVEKLSFTNALTSIEWRTTLEESFGSSFEWLFNGNKKIWLFRNLINSTASNLCKECSKLLEKKTYNFEKELQRKWPQQQAFSFSIRLSFESIYDVWFHFKPNHWIPSRIQDYWTEQKAQETIQNNYSSSSRFWSSISKSSRSNCGRIKQTNWSLPTQEIQP